ncbi:MAG: hypothetical protein WC700_07695 [Gemmatimonadaceae bacterium]|jgi:hypothetical protein
MAAAAATLTASFTFELTPCDRRLAEGVRLDGYVILNSMDRHTGKDNGIYDMVAEFVFCQVTDGRGEKRPMQFLFNYSIICAEHRGGIEAVPDYSASVLNDALHTMWFDSEELKKEAIRSMVEILRGDENSLMKRVGG